MFLPKLLVGGIPCFGCGVPVTLSFLKGTGSEIKGFIFNKENEAARPILTCRGGRSNIELSLAYKNGSGENKELYWKGFDRKQNKEINLNEQHTQEETTYRLTIFGTGTTRLGTLTVAMGDTYNDTTFNCNKNVFAVKDWTYSTREKDLWTWEKGFDKIELTLENCSSENGRRECDMKISEDSGLKWQDGFISKAIF